jgi:hypothetical protein
MTEPKFKETVVQEAQLDPRGGHTSPGVRVVKREPIVEETKDEPEEEIEHDERVISEGFGQYRAVMRTPKNPVARETKVTFNAPPVLARILADGTINPQWKPDPEVVDDLGMTPDESDIPPVPKLNGDEEDGDEGSGEELQLAAKEDA